jgi:hypothetical protein
MLDEKRLGFMAAYRISQLKPGEVKLVMNLLESNPEVKPKGTAAKLLYDRSKETENGLTGDMIRETLLSN